MSKNASRLLIHCSTGPGATALAAIDATLTFAAFEQEFDVLFTGAGVLQLIQEQGGTIGGKNLAKLLSSYSLYGIEMLYADAEALTDFRLGIDALIPTVVPVDAQEIDSLLRNSAAILSF